MNYPFKHIGDKIFQIRRLQGISRQKLSEKSGVAIRTLNLIEWQGQDSKLSTLLKIAEALNVNIHELIKSDKEG